MLRHEFHIWVANIFLKKATRSKYDRDEDQIPARVGITYRSDPAVPPEVLNKARDARESPKFIECVKNLCEANVGRCDINVLCNELIKLASDRLAHMEKVSSCKKLGLSVPYPLCGTSLVNFEAIRGSLVFIADHSFRIKIGLPQVLDLIGEGMRAEANKKMIAVGSLLAQRLDSANDEFRRIGEDPKGISVHVYEPSSGKTIEAIEMNLLSQQERINIVKGVGGDAITCEKAKNNAKKRKCDTIPQSSSR